MLRKDITFSDLDGNQVTETFYFSLSKAELAERQLSHNQGFDVWIKAIIERGDAKTIMQTFKDFILQSYGIKGVDNRQFVKSPEMSLAFEQTDAYSVLFVELVTDANAGLEFLRAIMPAGLMDEGPQDHREPEPKTVQLPQAQIPRVINRPVEDVPIPEVKSEIKTWIDEGTGRQVWEYQGMRITPPLGLSDEATRGFVHNFVEAMNRH